MARGRPIFRLGVLLVLFFFRPAGPAPASEPVQVDIAWFSGPLLTDCEGPRDEAGFPWFDELFDMAGWDQVFVPFNEPMSGPADRFFRGFFTLDSAEAALLSFSSDDGIDIFINSQPLGTWGHGCHAPGCVNMQVCGIIDLVEPVDVSAFLFPGENLIAAHVTNCDCCCSMDFNATLMVGGGDVPGVSFRRADGNQDGFEDLGDSIATLNCLFLGQPCSTCLDSEDVNDDGALDLSDSVAILSHLFLGGEPPAPPGSDCGPDPTADPLDCERYPHCP